MKILQYYQCEICKEQHKTEAEARDCEAQGMDKAVAKVGDIIKLHHCFGWYDGKKSWIINPDVKLSAIKSHGNCFGECCNYSFYWVVTKIDQDPDEPHRWRYHVWNKAMTGKNGHAHGYTFVGTHYTPIVIKNPPKFIVQDSKDLIGKDGQYLL